VYAVGSNRLVGRLGAVTRATCFALARSKITRESPYAEESVVGLGKQHGVYRDRCRPHGASPGTLAGRSVAGHEVPDSEDRADEAQDSDDRCDPASAAEHGATLCLLSQAVARLSDRDRTILKLRYEESRPFHEVGRILGLSESRVCQLHKRIIRHLRGQLLRALEEAA